MIFSGTLRRITRRVLVANPKLGPVYLGKVDLAESYMRLWIRLNVTPSVGFLITSKEPTDKQLVGSHLSLPVGYVDSALFFCMSTETIAYMENYSMDDHHRAPPHPLQVFSDVSSLLEWAPEKAALCRYFYYS